MAEIRNPTHQPLSPADAAAMIERLRPQAQELRKKHPGSMTDPDACLVQAIDEFASSRVQSFVPLLVMRRVKACMHAQDCTTTEF